MGAGPEREGDQDRRRHRGPRRHRRHRRRHRRHGCSAADLGITAAEQQQLAPLYAAGQSALARPGRSLHGVGLQLAVRCRRRQQPRADRGRRNAGRARAGHLRGERFDHRVPEPGAGRTRAPSSARPTRSTIAATASRHTCRCLNLKLSGPTVPASLMGIGVGRRSAVSTLGGEFPASAQPEWSDRRQSPRRLWPARCRARNRHG